VDDPDFQVLVDKLAIAAIDYLTGAYLGEDLVKQIELGLVVKVEEAKEARRY